MTPGRAKDDVPLALLKEWIAESYAAVTPTQIVRAIPEPARPTKKGARRRA